MAWYSLKEKKNKISKESARESLKEFLQFYEINLETDDEDRSQAIEKGLDDIVSYIMTGDIEFKKDSDSDINVIQHRESGSIEYKTRNVVKYQYRGKSDDPAARIPDMMESLASLPPGTFKNMKVTDHKVMKAVGVLFLSI